MYRILHVLDSLEYGGAQAFIMNIYRNIDRSEFQFDFLLHRDAPKSYMDEVKLLGGNVYFTAARNKGYFRNKKELRSFFKVHNDYVAVHLHESSLSYIEPLRAAKHVGIKTRIIHAHSSHGPAGFAHFLLHIINGLFITSIATDYLACGKIAGEWMYGKTKVRNRYQIIRNGINLKQYIFDEDIRDTVRKDFGLKDQIVIGHIGRFNKVKNHMFLLEVFACFKKKYDNAKLLLVGEGQLMNEVKNYAIDLGIKDDVIFAGVRNDVNKLLMGMDTFILPSFYEGFPVVLVEAQATGLPCVISDTISSEVLINKNVIMLSLSQEKDIWVDTIHKNINRLLNTDGKDIASFDIQYTIQLLCNIYKSFLK